MPIFFQQPINENTRLGIWKIEETEEFFLDSVPLQKEVNHPHKRLQHLSGRFLLRFLYPGFPYELIRIADTRKPYLPDEQYHFSISHCGDYAAAIVSTKQRVGIDIEIPTEKILRIQDKFLAEEEKGLLKTIDPTSEIGNPKFPTLLWSAKEAVFKWYGDGGVDFRKHIQLKQMHESSETIQCYFSKNETSLDIHYRLFDHLAVCWVMS